jgi:hypothetical protein
MNGANNPINSLPERKNILHLQSLCENSSVGKASTLPQKEWISESGLGKE